LAKANNPALLKEFLPPDFFADGQYIGSVGFNMSVSGGCDGLEVTALLVAGILAFPSTWKEKWKGLLYGVGVQQVESPAFIKFYNLLFNQFNLPIAKKWIHQRQLAELW
jgi:hypothetical protein